jgi:hypothetical protein
MPAPTDLVRILKNESSSDGGTEDDQGFPVTLSPNEDAPSVRGIFFQGDTGEDELVYVTRDGSGNLILKDAVTGAEVLLSSIVTDARHKTLLQLIHFIDEGPAEGFASGATKEIDGGMFPTEVRWKRADSTLLVKKTITRSGGGATNLTPTPIVWRMYGLDGSTVLATVSDAISYSGVMETGRIRTIS